MSFSRRSTRADIKQLAWAVALVWAFAGILGLLTRRYFRPHTVAVTIGVASFVTLAFVVIVAANLLVSLAADLVRWMRRSRGG